MFHKCRLITPVQLMLAQRVFNSCEYDEMSKEATREKAISTGNQDVSWVVVMVGRGEAVQTVN